MKVIKNALELSHDYIRMVVKDGDVVVDATAGNGNDTIFLAELVGEKGIVYSFDIQKDTLEKTGIKLTERNLNERVKLINDGHENIDKYIKCEIKAVMFNLGYLPGGDHSIHTNGDTTIIAIEKCMKLMSKNGIIMLVIYYGGDSGFEEKDVLIKYLESIDSKKYTVLVHTHLNQINCPPIAVCIEKL